MRNFSILILAFLIAGCKADSFAAETLFQIVKDGKIGFINNQGKIIIEPQFLSAGDFSEGLAPARINGAYGYINSTGQFVIPPQYDYAMPFSEGLAIVFKGEVPFYINQKGEKAFECNYHFVEPFINGRAVVRTATEKMGIIDKSGRLIIDTAFEKINPFIQGYAVVRGCQDRSDKSGYSRYNVAIIDSAGRFVVPYEKYRGIEDYQNGLFKVEIPPEKYDTIEGFSAQSGFIDKTGRLILSRSYQNLFFMSGYPHQELIKVNLYKYWIPEEKGISSTSEKYYAGYADMKGNIVINDTTFKSVTDFSVNRAFVEIKTDTWNRHYRIINTKGKFISDKKFDQINDKGFVNGVAIVEVDDKWGLIDTNANFVLQPTFLAIEQIDTVNNYLFYTERNLKSTSDYPELYGIAKTDGTIISKPIIQDFDRTGFKDSLLQCTIDGRLAYINKRGKIIWQQEDHCLKKLTDVNIDFMNRGYFYAHSEPNKNDLGGFGKSDNDAHKIALQDTFQPNSLSVVVKPNKKDSFQNRYNGMKVYVANNTTSVIQFNASDSRLNMKVQALNKRGKWKDIEYLPSSWCGNSYHTLTLKPNNYWRFTTPKYTGDFKTRLRIALVYINPNDTSEKRWERKDLTIYSNEYEGSINLGQFWRKRGYYPTNLMDPYNE